MDALRSSEKIFDPHLQKNSIVLIYPYTMPTLLMLTIGVPLGAGFLLLVGGTLRKRIAKPLAWIGFGFPVLAAIPLAVAFPESREIHGYAFVSKLDLGLEALGIQLTLGLNGIAFPLYLLAAVVGLAAGIQALDSSAESLPSYLMLLLFMQGGLLGLFSSIDIFFCYFFHEIALIPTFLMMGIWGGQGRRAIAMELTLYLGLGAILVLLGLIGLYSTSGMASFDLIQLKSVMAEAPLQDTVQRNLFGFLLIGFGILVALFPFHSWAPRGYAVAPTATAMLHAGVLKKFGLYGLIQIAAPLLEQGAHHWASLLAWLALGNIVLIGLVTIAQRDLKQMIGYSSVMHMGFIFLGIASFSVTGVSGAVLLMVAHGFSISLMLMLATSIQHRCGTYYLDAMGGLAGKAPVLAGFFIAATMASIGLPGLANFWGELAIFVSVWEFKKWMLFPAAAGIVLSAVYGLRAVADIFFGAPRQSAAAKRISPYDLRLFEGLSACILLGMLLWIGLWPKTLSSWIHEGVGSVIERTEWVHSVR